MLIRRELPRDVDAIGRVHAAAFRRESTSAEPVEVRLVEQLRRSDAWIPRLSLVAIVDGTVVGHVVCSRAAVAASGRVLGLGPIGVLPEYQRQGVGSALMHAILAAADARDEPLVVLLGEPGYYHRFGFVPAADLGIVAPDPSWGDYFQARRLSSHTPQLRGRFRYAPPFNDL